MGWLKSTILVTSISTVIFAYILYDPYVPAKYGDFSPYLVCAVFRFAWLAGNVAKIIGYEHNAVTNAVLQIPARIQAAEIQGVSFVDKVFAQSIPVRLYEKESQLKSKELKKAIVYFHGGGFHIGSIEAYDYVTKKIAEDFNGLVVSVEYRLTPKHTFPAAFDDCVAATKYFLEHASEFHVDPSRVALMGDSAGGNLAAVVSNRLHDESFTHQPKLQVLVYPVVQLLSYDSPSTRYNANGPLLTRTLMAYFTSVLTTGSADYSNLILSSEHVSLEVQKSIHLSQMNLDILPDDFIKSGYHRKVPGEDARFWRSYGSVFMNPYICPLLAANLTGAPETFISSCQFDPIRDDSFFYAYALRKAGVPVTRQHLDICYHGWLGGVTLSARANRDLLEIIHWIENKL